MAGNSSAPVQVTTENQPQPRRSMLTLWLVFAVCALPFVGALVVYQFAPPKSRMNYGELIEPRPLTSFSLPKLGGGTLTLADLKGKWTMVQADVAGCDPACRDKLYKMRQVRLTQGKNMDRVQRLWIVIDEAEVAPALAADYPGMLMARSGQGQLLAQLPAKGGNARGPIWLIDPLGNVMLRYPAGADPTGMKKDLQRLLSVSQVE